MEWQLDGELAKNDWIALVDRLQQVEGADNSLELARLSQTHQDLP